MRQQTYENLINRIEIEGECWLWQEAKDKYGYGKAKHQGKTRKVRHCCNPKHLEAVTHQENMRRLQSQKTHCQRGYEFTKSNTYRFTSGTRHCRTCQILYSRARRQRLKSQTQTS